MKLHNGNALDVQIDPERLAGAKNMAADFVAKGLTPSLVVFAARKGVIVLHEAYGSQGPESNAPPLKRDTIFPVRSITKPITATAAMILVDDGLLSLTRPVSDYIPEFAGEGKERVMVHHLLTHTSGMQDEEIEAQIDKNKGKMEIPHPRKSQDPWLNEYLHLSYDAPPWKAPGIEMSYANYNYNLLGEIIQRVSGQSLPDFAYKQIFFPLRMKNTRIGSKGIDERRIINRPENADWEPEANLLLTELHGSSSALSTAKDIAIFGQMFLNLGVYGDHRVLSRAAVKQMTRNHLPGITSSFLGDFFPEAGWGLGWSIRGEKKSLGEEFLSPNAYVHFGFGGSVLWCDPEYEFVGVILHVRLIDGDGQPIFLYDYLINPIMASIVEI